ncbi:MAG: hypothetical protein ACE5MH_05745 [Terriglobia bacterium]
MTFLVLKSYDGGRSWEPARRCDDFTSAAQAAEVMRSQHRMIRFRIDVETPAPRPGRPLAARRARHPVRSRRESVARRQKSFSARK